MSDRLVDGINNTGDVSRKLDEWRMSHPHYGCTTDRASKGVMVVVVIALIVLTYLPYVILNENRGSAGVLCVVIFHIPFCLMLGSYFQIVMIDPGTVPRWWHDAIAAEAASDYQVCRKCNMHKPPRAHFDSISERLVLNMDHFCPWVANTVGFYNRKFFVLFIGYTFVLCTWVCITMLVVFHEQLFPFFGSSSSSSTPADDGDDSVPHHTRILFSASFVINCLFSLMLSCFSYFHFKMAYKNETTIEGDTLPQFHLTPRENWCQVFGKNPWYWFLPVWGDGPDGDGIRWTLAGGKIDGLPNSRQDESRGTELL